MSETSYCILKKETEAQITEKKSRFIAHLKPTDSETEATEWIALMKKKYWDARHNCSAFVIGGKNGLTRCSDDGEPAGTAGRPMLEVLVSSGLHDVTAVVTRYFGGVLLGTGGLVRAYQSAVQAALDKAEILQMRFGYPFDIVLDYPLLGSVQNYLEKHAFHAETAYLDRVQIHFMVPAEEKDAVMRDLGNLSGGKIVPQIGAGEMYGA